jgi:hypothetical protein
MQLARCRTRVISSLAVIAPYLIAAVMTFAAIAKIANLEEFTELTSTFTVLPRGVRHWLPLVVPQIELLVAALLLLNPKRRGGTGLALAVLVAFTFYLLVQSFMPYVPPCNCFGVIRLASTAARENQFGIYRNLILIIFCLLSWDHVGRMSRRAEPANA